MKRYFHSCGGVCCRYLCETDQASVVHQVSYINIIKVIKDQFGIALKPGGKISFNSYYSKELIGQESPEEI